MDDVENDAPATVGEMIRRSRLARGWTQSHLANEAGAGRQTTIASWESGQNLVPMTWLVRLSNSLQWTSEEMERAVGMLACEVRARVEGGAKPEQAA